MARADANPDTPCNSAGNSTGNSTGNSKTPDRNKKSSQAFRTISEVATELGLPQHVLRFWETKFSSIKPMKRGGGRRYYRPDDLELLKRIRALLYDDGYTIKGVQKLLRQPGALPGTLDGNDGDVASDAATPAPSQAQTGAEDGGLAKKARGELEAILNDLESIRDGLK